MAVGDIIRVTVNQNLQSSVVQNVLYYKIESETATGDDLLEISEQFISQIITPAWKVMVSPELTFECLDIQKVFPLPIGAVRDFDVSAAGTNAGESLPAMNSALIQKFNPAVGGVGKKGRIYCAGILESQTSLGRANTDLFAAMEILATALKGDLEGGTGSGDYEPVWVIRKPDAPNKGSITGFVEDLIFEALPRIATQRRRRTPIRAVSF